jgi:hypothetical protein
VETGMETASQERRFVDAWSNIQTNLRKIRLGDSFGR